MGEFIKESERKHIKSGSTYKDAICCHYDEWFDKPLKNYLGWLESETGVEVSTLGTGARNAKE